MKKLLAVIMIMGLILPAAALAADPDPIVGVWYMCTGIIDDPEISKDTLTELNIFIFSADGSVFSSTYDVSPEGITAAKDYKAIAMWTKSEGKYYINVGFKGAQEMEVDQDSIFFPISDSLYRLRKMSSFNYILDMKRQ